MRTQGTGRAMTRMNRVGSVSARRCIFALAFLATGSFANATRDAEITHLLAFVAASNCLYIRNGSVHSPQDAVTHIRKKAAYYEDDIDSTERFIELSASRSTMSRKPYSIQCPGQPEVASAAWLLGELNRYRQVSGSGGAGETPRASAEKESHR